MKIAIALLTAALGASFPVHGADASDKARESALTAQAQDTEMSAKKRKRHRVYVYGPSYGAYAPTYGHYYPGYWAYGAADPSWQSPELRRLRALNRCVFDLGYGRWENCN